MKKKLFFSLATLTLFVAFTGCISSDESSMDVEEEQKLDLSEYIIDSLTIMEVFHKLTDLNNEYARQVIDPYQYSQSIKLVIEPLVHNGRELHSQLMKSVTRTQMYESLSLEERVQIARLEESQFAELSFIFGMESISSNDVSIDPRVVACLGVATGAAGFYDIILNTKQLGSVASATKALRLIGRRALGWIGVGIMVVDFTKCYYGN
ncbi:hypothetical protein [Lunatimonas lonarensis]|uniref:hypothetical protein n=1 Tax=Lunatimonas lonarensis TaxID=1232681 RepID=UPI0005682A4B|nr:hypothetical protein [Lunatimonas lonarensis]